MKIFITLITTNIGNLMRIRKIHWILELIRKFEKNIKLIFIPLHFYICIYISLSKSFLEIYKNKKCLYVKKSNEHSFVCRVLKSICNINFY